MNLDIRLPIGMLFLTIGVLLTVYGLITMGNAAMYERSLSIDINLWWGLAMLVFGGLMTYFGRTRAKPRPVETV
jgi:hypothetical protein